MPDVLSDSSERTSPPEKKEKHMIQIEIYEEFEKWLERMGVMEDGKLTKWAGDLSIFD